MSYARERLEHHWKNSAAQETMKSNWSESTVPCIMQKCIPSKSVAKSQDFFELHNSSVVHNTVEIRVEKKNEVQHNIPRFYFTWKTSGLCSQSKLRSSIDRNEHLYNLLQVTACCSSDGGDRVMCKWSWKPLIAMPTSRRWPSWRRISLTPKCSAAQNTCSEQTNACYKSYQTSDSKVA